VPPGSAGAFGGCRLGVGLSEGVRTVAEVVLGEHIARDRLSRSVLGRGPLEVAGRCRCRAVARRRDALLDIRSWTGLLIVRPVLIIGSLLVLHGCTSHCIRGPPSPPAWRVWWRTPRGGDDGVVSALSPGNCAGPAAFAGAGLGSHPGDRLWPLLRERDIWSFTPAVGKTAGWFAGSSW